MHTDKAFRMGQASQGNPLMVFDWKKVAEIIRDEKPHIVQAGLQGDWEYTGGTIYLLGKIVDSQYTYLASTWAKPQALINDEFRDCFVFESETEWDSDTKWPDEAKQILTNKQD